MGFQILPMRCAHVGSFYFLTAAPKIFRESMSGGTSTGIHRKLGALTFFAE